MQRILSIVGLSYEYHSFTMLPWENYCTRHVQSTVCGSIMRKILLANAWKCLCDEVFEQASHMRQLFKPCDLITDNLPYCGIAEKKQL